MLAALLGTATVAAQGYYDDDIYFDASKAKKTAKTIKRSAAGQTEYASFAAADTYTPTGTSTRSVDEYNRRGIFAPATVTDSISVDSLAALGNFSYTRRIERFHNPDVVVEYPDDNLVEMYYSTAENPVNVNIYVNNPGYWGWGYPYYADPFWYNGPSWAWNWGWGPSWAWGPSWSFGWGLGPSWGWGPSWAWGPSWGWGGPAWGWNPAPRPPMGGHPNGVRPGAGNTHYAGSYRRPGSTNRGPSGSNWNINNVGNRPAAGSALRPGNTNNQSGTQYRPGAAGSSYRGNGNTTNRNEQNNSYRRSNNNNNSNLNRSNNTYRNSNTGSFRSGSSGGSFRGSAGGGSMRSSGGGSRGGGRR